MLNIRHAAEGETRDRTGEPIFEGLQLYDQRLILAGAIPAAALAVLVDQLLGLLERALAPRGVG